MSGAGTKAISATNTQKINLKKSRRWENNQRVWWEVPISSMSKMLLQLPIQDPAHEVNLERGNIKTIHENPNMEKKNSKFISLCEK